MHALLEELHSWLYFSPADCCASISTSLSRTVILVTLCICSYAWVTSGAGKDKWHRTWLTYEFEWLSLAHSYTWRYQIVSRKSLSCHYAHSALCSLLCDINLRQEHDVLMCLKCMYAAQRWSNWDTNRDTHCTRQWPWLYLLYLISFKWPIQTLPWPLYLISGDQLSAGYILFDVPCRQSGN